MFKMMKIRPTWCLCVFLFLLFSFLVGSTIIPQGIQTAIANELPLQSEASLNEQVRQSGETLVNQGLSVQVNDFSQRDLTRAEKECFFAQKRSLKRKGNETVMHFTQSTSDQVQIQGTVKTVASEPANGGTVRIENVDEYNNYVDAEIDAQGNYSAGSLKAGFYYIQAKPATLYDDDNTEFPSILQMIEIKDNGPVLTLPLRFTKAEVEGIVTNPDSSFAKNVDVEISNWHIDQYMYVWVDENDNGHYAIGGLPSGTYTIDTYSSGYNSGYFDSLPKQITIKANNPDDPTLTAQTVNLQTTTKELQGTVTDRNNNPVEAGIYITSSTDSDGKWINTDDQNKGIYALGGLPTGDYTVTAIVDNEAYSTPQKVHLEQGKVQTLNLSEGPTELTGQIKLYDGTTSSTEFKMYIRPLQDSNSYYGYYQDLTTTNGGYQIGCLADGNYLITVYSPDYSKYATVLKVVTINSKKPATLDITLPKPQFSGTVKNPDNSIAQGAGVGIYSKNWSHDGYSRYIDVSSDGKYAFGDIPDGDYYLYAFPYHSDCPYTKSFSQQIKISGGKVTNFTDSLKLTTPAVQGRVLAPNGLPTSNANTKLIKDKSTWNNWTVRGGIYRLGGVSDGNYTLTADVPDGEDWKAPAPIPVTLKAGQTKTINLQFSDSSTSSAPTIISTNPTDQSEGVDPSQSITVTFSKNVTQGDFYDHIVLQDSAGNSVTITKTFKDNTLTLKPKSALNFNTDYRATIPAGAVKDSQGNAIAAEYTFGFRTIEEQETLGAPVNLKATNVGAVQLTLTWDEESGAASYNVYRAGKAKGPFKKLASVSTNTFTDQDKSLKASTTYWYYVTAVNTAGDESGSSDSVSVTTKASAPTGLKATTVSSTSVALVWKSIKGNTYKVYRSNQKDGVYELISTVDAASFKDNMLSPATTYWYQVSAVNTAGDESAQSTAVGAATKAIGPTGLEASVKSKSQIDLSWNAVERAQSYNIYRATSVNGKYSTVGTAKINGYQNTKLKAGVTYWYKVTAVTSTGEGDYSEVISATTLSK